MRDVKVVQLDSVNVAARTHYMPFYSRLGPYDAAKLDTWASSSGELFEYWCHAASVAPIEHYSLFDWRRNSFGTWKSIEELLTEHPDYVDRVFEEVATNGPISTSDLEDGGERQGAWWGWGKGKLALEYLFANGRITSYRGNNFTRIYDLPDRLIPEEHRNGSPSKDESYRTLLLLAAEAYGVATDRDLADYYRMSLKEARIILEQLVAEGALEPATVAGWADPAYLHPRAKRPRSINNRTLLSPFDSMVWERDRTLRLFDFHYRIEIYVPKEKRQYGYYVLPFMLDGELVGRVDVKADRAASQLLVQAAHVEPGRDPARVATELGAELETFAEFLTMDDVVVVRQGDLAGHLSAVL